MDVQVPFVLRSADDLATPYTNYTSGYKVSDSKKVAAKHGSRQQS
jgi:hypothetical protein